MSPDFFNQLSPEQKAALFNLQPKEGMVFWAHNPIAKKEKFFVIIGESGDKICLAYFFINSRINPNIATSPELEALHMPILKSDYKFLSHDSYIDCSRLHEIETDKVKQFFQKIDGGKYICALHQTVVDSLKYMIKKSPTISPKLKKKYGYL